MVADILRHFNLNAFIINKLVSGCSHVVSLCTLTVSKIKKMMTSISLTLACQSMYKPVTSKPASYSPGRSWKQRNYDLINIIYIYKITHCVQGENEPQQKGCSKTEMQKKKDIICINTSTNLAFTLQICSCLFNESFAQKPILDTHLHNSFENGSVDVQNFNNKIHINYFGQ